MFATMPQTPPSNSFGRPGQGHHPNHRPAFPSPLSSSPVRASSLSPPPFPQQQQTISQPLSPCNSNLLNALSRQTQSSPTQGGQSFYPSPTNSENHNANGSNNSKFRFASRNPRPNPVLKRREDAQEGRRRLFFQNVRQRQEDKRWERRGGEDELLKLEWWRLTRERNQAKSAEEAQYLGEMDADLAAQEEEEMRMQLQQLQQQQQQQQQQPPYRGYLDQDTDALMADTIAQQEEAELEALVSDLEGKRGSAHFSDDEDYDGLFMDLIQQQQQQRQEDGAGMGMNYSQDVEMT